MDSLTPDTMYNFRVFAVNSDGKKSGSSKGLGVKTKPLPPPPPEPLETQKFVMQMKVMMDPNLFFEPSMTNAFLKGIATAMGVDSSNVHLRTKNPSAASFLELQGTGFEIEIDIVGPNAAAGAPKMSEMAAAGTLPDSLHVDASSIKIRETAVKEVITVIEMKLKPGVLSGVQEDPSKFTNALCTALGLTNGTLKVTKMNGVAIPKGAQPTGDENADSDEGPEPEPELPDPVSNSSTGKGKGGGSKPSTAGGGSADTGSSSSGTASASSSGSASDGSGSQNAGNRSNTSVGNTTAGASPAPSAAPSSFLELLLGADDATAPAPSENSSAMSGSGSSSALAN